MSGSPFRSVQRTTRLAASADAVWAWHARPGAFERLTPPWERVRVLERTGSIEEEGSRARIEIGMGPLAVPWTAVHRDVQPGRRFVDEQVEGPFSQWVHTHRFDPEGDGCLLTDRIEYLPPFGLLGAAADQCFIRRQVERMLAYRHAVTAADLAAHAAVAAAGPQRVVVSGASGLVGSALVPFLTTGGHTVTRLVRRAPGPGEARWDPATGQLDAAALDGADVVVHLAGEGIAEGRWTAERKRRIRDSRVLGTRLLAERMAALPRGPRVLVSASAIGVYGSRGDEVLDESSPLAADFLAEVGREWEDATAPAAEAGVRVVLLRFGVILSPAGGALAKMLPPFRLGLGGRVGHGRQWMSWISIDDAIGAVHHAIFHEPLAGPVNVVGPEPVTNAAFTDALGRVLSRPAIAAVPAFALRAAFGEMAEATVLASSRVLPRALLGSGYRFRHPTVESALRHVLGR